MPLTHFRRAPPEVQRGSSSGERCRFLPTGRVTAFGAVETLAAASPTAAAVVMHIDGLTSVGAALSAGAGSAAGVVPEAAVPVVTGSAVALVAVVAVGRRGDR